ncbi:hypothetical protein TEQG_05602 [Trichophyton equinum CBS 127.97]|uniref:F-box domain-containing protein n=1 Tax=Trichophyton equinum (strain ATCC MYA-4606 / CBS 127.97) TaxID=559882 RepID=F2PXI6_TRIEC|nr:hypothetical protein TEQG_05602 [Trichophyton equinum CBS 127.97]
MGDSVFKKPLLVKRDPQVAARIPSEETKDEQETPVKMWFNVISLSARKRICGPYRLRRLLLNRSANDVLFHVAVPHIQPLSDTFLEATEPRSSPTMASPDTPGQSSLSSVSTGFTSSIGQDSLAATDGMPEASPDTVSDMLGQMRDGELLHMGTIQQTQLAAGALSPAKSEQPKRKREEESSSDGDISSDGRPSKVSKCSEDDVPSLQSHSSDGFESYQPQLQYLPLKVYHHILQKLKLLDIIHLGLTSRFFLRILAIYLQSIITINLGQLAGESIICLGDVAGQNDFPPVVFSDPQLRSIFAPHLHKLVDTDHPTLPEFLRECRPLLSHRLRTPSDCGFLDSKWFNEEFYKLPITVIGQMIELLCPTEGDFYPPGAEWILRNITTKEYVCKPKHGLGLGDVILFKASWSSKPPVGIQVNVGAPVHRGAWAGHRFEIVQLEHHKREMMAEMTAETSAGSSTEKPWTDVTTEVIDELEEMWEFECGRYWKSLTRRPVG